MKKYALLFSVFLSASILFTSCGPAADAHPRSKSSGTAVSSEEDKLAVTKKYYDYLCQNALTSSIINENTDQPFTDEQMVSYAMGDLMHRKAYDHQTGNSKAEYFRIIEKYFGKKITKLPDKYFKYLDNGNVVFSTETGFMSDYWVLRELTEHEDGSKTGLFYRIENPETGTDEQTIKKDLLAGKFAEYYSAPIPLVEITFEEKTDENGMLYFKFISTAEKGIAKEPYLVYGTN